MALEQFHIIWHSLCNKRIGNKKPMYIGEDVWKECLHWVLGNVFNTEGTLLDLVNILQEELGEDFLNKPVIVDISSNGGMTDYTLEKLNTEITNYADDCVHKDTCPRGCTMALGKPAWFKDEDAHQSGGWVPCLDYLKKLNHCSHFVFARSICGCPSLLGISCVGYDNCKHYLDSGIKDED